MNRLATASCSVEHCTRWVFTHPTRRRMAVGWFFARDGSVTCPAHLSGELAEFAAATRDHGDEVAYDRQLDEVLHEHDTEWHKAEKP